MRRVFNVSGGTAALIVAACALAVPRGAWAATKPITCHLDFTMSGWSAFYKTASGKGKISCSNGQSEAVTIRVKGGGLTFGKSTVDHGHGEFSGVYDISETLGHYAFSQAHAGAVKSSAAMVLTKGSVSLALTGLGRGWDLGVDFGAFIIEPAGKQK